MFVYTGAWLDANVRTYRIYRSISHTHLCQLTVFVKNLKSHIFVTLARRNCASECAYKSPRCASCASSNFGGKSCNLYARKYGICLVKKNTVWNCALGSPAHEFCPFVFGFSRLLLGPLVFWVYNFFFVN